MNPRVACEEAWGASEAIGRLAMAAFATPMALVMRMRMAVVVKRTRRLENTSQRAYSSSSREHESRKKIEN